MKKFYISDRMLSYMSDLVERYRLDFLHESPVIWLGIERSSKTPYVGIVPPEAKEKHMKIINVNDIRVFVNIYNNVDIENESCFDIKDNVVFLRSSMHFDKNSFCI